MHVYRGLAHVRLSILLSAVFRACMCTWGLAHVCLSILLWACEGLGMAALLSDLGVVSKVRLWIDPSAAKSISSRTGLGKVWHLEVR